MVVEDEGILALFLCQDLKRSGHIVCGPVADGQSAIDLAGRERPDLILMDIGLPGPTNGIEAMEKIRSFSPVPVIFMTGYAEPDVRARAMQLGQAAYLVKPAGIQQMEPVIAALLNTG